MLKSKVLEIIAVFSKEEVKSFKLFLASPFHNKNKLAAALFNELLKFYPKFEHKELTKENLFKKIFRGSEFEEWKIRNLLAVLSKAADEYLTIGALNKKPALKYILLNSEFLYRELNRHFEINNKEAGKEQEITQTRDSQYYYEKYVTSYQSMMNRRRMSYEFHDIYSDVKKSEKFLEEFCVLELSRLYQPAITADLSIQTSSDFKYFDILYNYLTGNKDNLNPSAALYLKFFTLVKNFDRSSYFDLKKAIIDNDKIFPEPERNNFYILLHNFLIYRINNLREDYWEEYGDIQELMVEKKVGMTIHGKVNPLLFRNAVKIFVRNNNLEKADVFIEKYYHDISEEFRMPNYYYAQALVKFHRKEFESSLELASKVKYEDFLMKFLVYSLILRNYYELGYMDNCYALLDTAHQGIIKDKIANESYKINYLHFITYFRKILDARSRENYSELEIVKRGLEAELMVAAKDWLIEKTEELLKKQ